MAALYGFTRTMSYGFTTTMSYGFTTTMSYGFTTAMSYGFATPMSYGFTTTMSYVFTTTTLYRPSRIPSGPCSARDPIQWPFVLRHDAAPPRMPPANQAPPA